MKQKNIIFLEKVLMYCKTRDQLLSFHFWRKRLRLGQQRDLYFLKLQKEQLTYVERLEQLKGTQMEVEKLRQQENPTPKPFNKLAAEIHENNKPAGWWDADKIRRPAEIHMLIVTEIAEATEEIRKQTPPLYGEFNANDFDALLDDKVEIVTDLAKIKEFNLKPEGELIELADAMIRILDYCGHKGWDLDGAIELKRKFNTTRSRRHGGKAL